MPTIASNALHPANAIRVSARPEGATFTAFRFSVYPKPEISFASSDLQVLRSMVPKIHKL